MFIACGLKNNGNKQNQHTTKKNEKMHIEKRKKYIIHPA